jgi:hypothetical protein
MKLRLYDRGCKASRARWRISLELTCICMKLALAPGSVFFRSSSVSSSLRTLLWDDYNNFGVAIIRFLPNLNLPNVNQFVMMLDVAQICFLLYTDLCQYRFMTFNCTSPLRRGCVPRGLFVRRKWCPLKFGTWILSC